MLQLLPTLTNPMTLNQERRGGAAEAVGGAAVPAGVGLAGASGSTASSTTARIRRCIQYNTT